MSNLDLTQKRKILEEIENNNTRSKLYSYLKDNYTKEEIYWMGYNLYESACKHLDLDYTIKLFINSTIPKSTTLKHSRVQAESDETTKVFHMLIDLGCTLGGFQSAKEYFIINKLGRIISEDCKTFFKFPGYPQEVLGYMDIKKKLEYD